MRVLLSTLVLMVMFPIVAMQIFSAMYRQQKIGVYLDEFIGQGMRRVQYRTLMVNNRPLCDIDSWLHYFKGNLNLFGPRKMQLNEALSLTHQDRSRFRVAPGLISPYEIKQGSGIAHIKERAISTEFALKADNSRRFQLLVVWVVQSILGTHRTKLITTPIFNLFGVDINNASMESAVETIMATLNHKVDNNRVSKFAFVNADCGNHLSSDFEYKEILNEFDAVYPDGIGIKIAARMQGYAMKENVNGTDLFPLLCEQLQAQGKSLYLHGATEVTVKKVLKKLAINYPKLKVVGYSNGYSFNKKQAELRARINSCKPDLLLVAMGAPRQERWIKDNGDTLDIKAAIGVGGLFDFYSGDVSRAPEWLRELSLEWVWRLMQQPKDKVQRYLIGNPLFLVRALKASISKKPFVAAVGDAS